MTLTIEAPTDAQLRFVQSLCAEYGWEHPDAICSKREATEIIDAMFAGSYQAWKYAFPFSESVPF